MLSTSFVVAGLSTGNAIALACVGAAFIIFSLISSFVLPRRNPNFPGKGIGWFVALSALFLVAMLSSVIVFGKEKPEAEAAGGETTTAAATTTTSTPSPAPAPAPQGNATAGKTVFETAGCSSCHTLKDAGSTGTVGPNLDQLKPDFATVKHQVENGGGAMPAFKDQLKPTQIDDVAAYVSSVAGK
jgi:mono/diheme cytochrome c family protein